VETDVISVHIALVGLYGWKGWKVVGEARAFHAGMGIAKEGPQPFRRKETKKKGGGGGDRKKLTEKKRKERKKERKKESPFRQRLPNYNKLRHWTGLFVVMCYNLAGDDFNCRMEAFLVKAVAEGSAVGPPL
jgi:hypothetical protein